MKNIRILAGILLALSLPAFACEAVTGNQQNVIATGIFQTQQVSQSETAAADGGPQPTPTLAPTLSFEGINPPEGVTQQDGRWLFQDREVIITHHVNEDGSTDIWLSFAVSPDWPLYIQNEDGTWKLGVEAWTGAVTVVNANEVPLIVSSSEVASNQNEDLTSEPQELAPLEIFSFSSFPPGVYELVFSFTMDQPVEMSCKIEFQFNSHYYFVAVPNGIVVSEESFVPQTSSDLNILTSPLCKQ